MTTKDTGAGQPAPFKLGFSGSRHWIHIKPSRIVVGPKQTTPIRSQKELSHLVFSIIQHVESQIDLPIEIHVGDAMGIDLIVQDCAVEFNYPLFIYGANDVIRHAVDGKHVSQVICKGNYLARDRHLVDNVDMIYGLWNGQSRGTKYTLDYAKQQGVRSHLLHVTAQGIKTIW